jgi:glycosyltransferase involved in cell wall biosynthesis
MSGRPKVLLLKSSYPTPEQPVAAIFVREYARLAAQDAELAVVHLDRGGADSLKVERRDDEGIPTVRVRYPSGRPGTRFAWHVRAARAAWNNRPLEPDLIFAHFVVAGLPAVALGRLHGVPVLISENWGIFLPDCPDPLTLPVKAAGRVAFGGARLVLPASAALEQGIRNLGVRTPMRVLPNVVDDELFHPSPAPERHDPPRLLTVGMFYDNVKGIDLLIKAMALLDRPAHLDIVGDGAERVAYEEFARTLGVQDRITFHGALAKSEVAALMRNADVFVLASRTDNNPVVLLEALATGLPVAATRVGGIPEIINDQNGLLARREDAHDIARTIGGVLDRLDSYDREVIADEARARFGPERIRADLSRAFAETVGAH